MTPLIQDSQMTLGREGAGCSRLERQDLNVDEPATEGTANGAFDAWLLARARRTAADTQACDEVLLRLRAVLLDLSRSHVVREDAEAAALLNALIGIDDMDEFGACLDGLARRVGDVAAYRPAEPSRRPARRLLKL